MYNLIAHYNSGPSSELVSSIKIVPNFNYVFNIVYRVEIADLQAGDLIQCGCQGECTNPYASNVMLAGYIVLTKNSSDLTGLLVADAAGYNITPGNHHGMFVFNGTLVVPDNTYKFASMVIYSASSMAKSNWLLKVEKGYGRIYVMHYRPQ